MDIAEAKRRAKRGPRILLMRRMVTLMITFVSTITVARLVAPREYGLANMSIVIMAFAQIFRDFGVTNALLRKGHIDQSELTMIFWFNVTVTTIMTLIIAALAPAASRFYDQPGLTLIIFTSLIGFQLGGIALQHRALINRDLRFSTSATIDIVSLLVGFATTITLAYIRRDVWAIVIGNVAQSSTAALLSVLFSRWRPGRPRLHPELLDLVKFGANTSVFSVSTFLSNNFASIMIGHFLGPSLLGQYNRAQVLFQMPSANLVRPITQATMPLLTRLRIHPEDYREAYLGLVRKLCMLLMPASVILFFAAIPLTTALLGSRWYEAGQALTALAPALGAISLAYSLGDVFVTQDRSAELRNLGLLEFLLRASAISAGVMFGLVTAALAFTGSTIAVVILRVLVAGRKGPVTARDQFRSAIPSVPPSLGAAIAAGTAWLLADFSASGLRATAIIIAGIVGTLGAAVMTKPSRSALGELVESMAGERAAKKLRLI